MSCSDSSLLRSHGPEFEFGGTSGPLFSSRSIKLSAENTVHKERQSSEFDSILRACELRRSIGNHSLASLSHITLETLRFQPSIAHVSAPISNRRSFQANARLSQRTLIYYLLMRRKYLHVQRSTIFEFFHCSVRAYFSLL